MAQGKGPFRQRPEDDRLCVYVFRPHEPGRGIKQPGLYAGLCGEFVGDSRPLGPSHGEPSRHHRDFGRAHRLSHLLLFSRPGRVAQRGL